MSLHHFLNSKKQEEAKHLTDSEHVKIEYSSLLQKESFIDENKSRLESEISRLNQEKEEIKAETGTYSWRCQVKAGRDRRC